MATMNTPAANDGNWYRAVTDNWTSIEANLIDQAVVTAKGDLLTAKSPFGPARLSVGSNGQVLLADSTQPTGLTWNSVTAMDRQGYMDMLVYDKRFFSAAGLLPGTKHYETPIAQPPVPDYDKTTVTPTIIGTTKRWPTINSWKLLGWDLGAQRQRILIIFSEFWSQTPSSTGLYHIFVANDVPASGDFTTGNNGYLYAPIFYNYNRMTNGAFTGLSATNYLTEMPGQFGGAPFGVAFLFDNGNIRLFYRYGNFQWIEGTVITDGTYTTLRHVGLRLYGEQEIGPVSVWYDA